MIITFRPAGDVSIYVCSLTKVTSAQEVEHYQGSNKPSVRRTCFWQKNNSMLRNTFSLGFNDRKLGFKHPMVNSMCHQRLGLEWLNVRWPTISFSTSKSVQQGKYQILEIDAHPQACILEEEETHAKAGQPVPLETSIEKQHAET